MRHARPSLSVPPLALLAACALIATAEMPGDARAASDSGASEVVPAHWVKKNISFTYQGFTSHYSCDGLGDSVRLALLELGARRSDLNVHEKACTTAPGAPNPSPGVYGTFSVLEPVSGSAAPGAGGGAAPVQAQWVTVHLKLEAGSDHFSAYGDCELIDQIRQKIIPLVTARNLKFTESCVPHQFMLSGSQVEVQVLLPKGAKPVTPPAG